MKWAVFILCSCIALVAVKSATNAMQGFCLPAGTATAGTAPLKFQSGPLLSSVEAGAIEYRDHTFYATTYLKRRSIVLGQDVPIADVVVSGTDVETTVYEAEMAANYLTPGKYVNVETKGRFSSVAAAAGQATIRLKVAGVTVLTLVSVAGVNTDSPFSFSIHATCRSVGMAGTIIAFMDWEEGANAKQMVCSATPIVIDTTQVNTAQVTVQFGSNNASNSFESVISATLCVDDDQN